MRFTLSSLLLVIALAAFFCAAITRSNSQWQMYVVTLTLASFLAATLIALAGAGSSRWFCVGLVLVGWFYLAVSMWFGNQTRHLLLSHQALVKLEEVTGLADVRRAPNGSVIYWTEDGRIGLIGGFGARYLTAQQADDAGLLPFAYPYMGAAPNPEYYYNIGHFAWSWLLGIVGGYFCLWLQRKIPAAS